MTTPTPPIDFREIAKELRSASLDRSRVLTVPVWGWTGDGKTCSILTLFHYADPTEHGIGLSLVDDVSELERAIAGVAAYDGLRLVELARSTSDRLPSLAETFIDACEWPPGTDAPTPYLLGIRGVLKTYGFLYLPDLQGGAFRGGDGPARAVLASADGCAVLVDPSKYAGADVESRRYKNAVDQRVQACVEAGIPAAVMISKADKTPPDNTAAIDQTRMRLSMVVEGATTVRLFEVSVLGEDVAMDGRALPVPASRNPVALLEAWAWLLSRSLLNAGERPHRAPPVRLAASVDRPLAPPARIAEVRQAGSFSNPPGRVLCGFPGDTKPAFLCLNGDALSVATVETAGDKPNVQPLGRVPNFSEEDYPQASVLAGEVFLGGRRGVNAIWHGRAGDDLAKVALPLELDAWAAVGAQNIAGIDASGRIHLLVRSGDRWEQRDFVAEFLERSDHFEATWIPQHHAFAVANGTAVGVIEVRASSFTDRLTLPVKLSFAQEDRALLSPSGMTFRALHDEASCVVTVGDVETALDIDVDLTDAASSVAGDRAALCCVDSDRVLHVVRMAGKELVHVSSSSALPAKPTGIAWALGHPWLMVSFADAWSVFRLRGFDD